MRKEQPDELELRRDFGVLLQRLRRLPAKARASLQSGLAQELVKDTLAIDTPRGPLSFVLLGTTSGGRAVRLLTRQPGTIAWIDSFRPKSVFWDIGANVGVYTLYAALRGDTRVVAFEPAAVNYFLLAANCEANKLDPHVECLLVGIGSERGVARLDVSQFESARSFSFGGEREPQHRGRQAALVLSMDQLVEEYGVACPNYIKVDTPRMTEEIIAGGLRLLQRPEVRELHIELKEHSKRGMRIVEMLERSGFVAASRHDHGSVDVTFTRRGS